ncbi:MAG: hypothetical protein MUC65_05410, partial [Pontiellaceae bacterium]|nr:hypothetical protein [Pontiellaceae bacterium]
MNIFLSRSVRFFAGVLLAGAAWCPQQSFSQTFSDEFNTLNPSVWTQADRGELAVRDGVLALKDCYVHAGDLSWKNYELEFKARAPSDADTVRIFAGFRYNSDQNRYVFGLRGGNNNDLFLARYGDRNKDALLDI